MNDICSVGFTADHVNLLWLNQVTRDLNYTNVIDYYNLIQNDKIATSCRQIQMNWIIIKWLILKTFEHFCIIDDTIDLNTMSITCVIIN